MEKINSFSGEYSFLSNFYDAKVTYEGLTYLNSEAAYQAQKCISQVDKEKYTWLGTYGAKRAGRVEPLCVNWDLIKVPIMYQILKCKFEQNEDIREKLLATGDAILEEGNTWGDRIWGTVDGIGNNFLGKLLMKVREELRSQQTNA